MKNNPTFLEERSNLLKYSVCIIGALLFGILLGVKAELSSLIIQVIILVIAWMIIFKFILKRNIEWGQLIAIIIAFIVGFIIGSITQIAGPVVAFAVLSFLLLLGIAGIKQLARYLKYKIYSPSVLFSAYFVGILFIFLGVLFWLGTFKGSYVGWGLFFSVIVGLSFSIVGIILIYLGCRVIGLRKKN